MFKRFAVMLSAFVLLLSGAPAGQLIGTASAFDILPPGCTPYGPWEGFQYDPQLLMKKMGEPRSKAPVAGPYLSAHRGAWGTDPGLPQPAAENSITAIDNAAQLKFEMVELDVHMAGDGKLVLMHDYTMGRTTNYPQDGTGHWDVFNQKTPGGIGPIVSGDPPLLQNWNDIRPYNELISGLTSTEISQMQLRIFNRSTGILGTINFGGNNVTAKGSWTVTYETVPTLRQALEHVGNNYPGMTVVLDLRHVDEVTEAMNVIDQVTDCQGTPANEWVILKPFANVFPAGYYTEDINEVGETVYGIYGERANNYKWIPVVSFRLVPPNPKGSPSVIPGSPGPDTSQIYYDALTYLRDGWDMETFPNIVTYEIGYNGSANSNLKPAYEWAVNRVKNMKSWRPPDIDVVKPVVNPANGKTIIGFNWKDDGMGAYPVYKEDYQGYEIVREHASIITVDDAVYVLKMEIATRDAAKMSISRPVNSTNGQMRTDLQYRFIDSNSLKALDVEGNYSGPGNKIEIWENNNGLPQTWLLKLVPGLQDHYYYIVHRDSGKVLEVKQGSQNKLQLNDLISENSSYNAYQVWRFQQNSDGTYTVINAGNNYALNVSGAGTGNGTEVIAWPQSGGAVNEKWHLVPVTSFVLQDQSSKKLISVVNNETHDNATVAIWDNTNTPGQEWRFVNNGDGTYTILNPNSQKVLTIYGGAQQPYGTPVNIYTNVHADNQRWRLLYNREDNTYTLMNPVKPSVLNIEGAGTQNGTITIIWDTQSNFHPNEKLKIGLWGAVNIASSGDIAMTAIFDNLIVTRPIGNDENISWIVERWSKFDATNNQSKIVWKFYDPKSRRYLGPISASGSQGDIPMLVDEREAMIFISKFVPFSLETETNLVIRRIPDNYTDLYYLDPANPLTSVPILWSFRPVLYPLH